MIARATLALMLAGPAAMGCLTAAQPAAAHTRKQTVVLPPAQGRERLSLNSHRRHRTMAASHRQPRREVAVPVAMLDDGLAYDTPRATVEQSAAAAYPGHASVYQTGTASWYGGKAWQGHRMSDGTRYDQDGLTAAHATLPLGSRVLVTLIDSDRSVVVTITDRPGSRSRVIDLSRGAAAALGMMSRGVAQVSLTPL